MKRVLVLGLLALPVEAQQNLRPAALNERAAPGELLPWVGSGRRVARFQKTISSLVTTTVDVAYLAAADMYFATWTADSQSGIYVAGRTLGPNGAPAGGIRGFTNFTTGPYYAYEAHTASIEGARSFAVVMIGGLFFNSDGWMTVVDEFGNFSPPVIVANPSAGVGSIDVGGGAMATDDDFLVAFSSVNITVVQVDTDTLSIVKRLFLTSPPSGSFDGWVAITPSGASTGRYLVTWIRSTNVLGDVWGAVIDRDLNVLAAPFPIATDAANEVDPDVDGDGTNWIVAFERTGPMGDPDIICRGVSYVPSTGGVQLSPEHVVEGDAGQAERDPSVAWLGESFLIGYTEVVGGNLDVFVESIDSFDCSSCQGKYSVLGGIVDSTKTNDEAVKIAGQRSAGSPGSQALVTWISTERALFSESSAGTRVFQADDGAVREMGGKSPNGGSLTSTCTRASNANVALRLQDAAPGAVAHLMLGTSPRGVRFAGGTLVPDPLLTWTTRTDAFGRATLSLAVPAQLSFAGQEFLAQWVIRTPRASAARPTRSAHRTGLSFSNAIEITLE